MGAQVDFFAQRTVVTSTSNHVQIRLGCAGCVVVAKPVSRKRGFSGFLGSAGKWSCEDAEMLNLQDSWHYTWQGNFPTQGNKCDGKDVTSEFVPMVIGVKC